MATQVEDDNAAAPPPIRSRRIVVVDLLRGLAIVLMALDHVREFLQAQQVDPLDLSKASSALFLTRWVTHFCPSLFILLAGASIALGLSNRRSRLSQSRFVFVRGLWLVVLELTIVHIGWQFNLDFRSALGQVIWVIGWSMVCMSLIIWLPVSLVTAIGLVLIFGHNALDSISLDSFGTWAWMWRFLHAGGPISGKLPFGIGAFSIYIAYPLIPWVGVMAAGFGFGRLLRWESSARTPTISTIGVVMVLLFVVLRGGNIYGDPHPWTPQGEPARTLLSILNCQKYPPSLAFLLMTLGPVLALWPLWERASGAWVRFLVTFGRVPLFFYVVHLFVIHAVTMMIVFAQTGAIPDWLWNFPPGHAGPGTGVNLPALYLIWVGVVLSLYPVCRWYDLVKSRNPNSLLRFL